MYEQANSSKSGPSYSNTRANGLDETRSALKDARHFAQEKVERSMGEVERQIRANPVQATLLAAGAGLVFGALFAPNRRPRRRSAMATLRNWQDEVVPRQLRSRVDDSLDLARRTFEDIHPSDYLHQLSRLLDPASREERASRSLNWLKDRVNSVWQYGKEIAR